MICKHILLITFVNESDLIFCPESNSFKYFYLTQIIQFAINHFCTPLKFFNYCYVAQTI